MNINIEATPKEIAALVLELQERRRKENLAERVQEYVSNRNTCTLAPGVEISLV